MHSALDVAKYIISKCLSDRKPISNLQLQKILYYIQKEFLRLKQEAFNDDFEAWQFGPVIPDVYYNFCGFGAMPITVHYDVDISECDKRIIDPIVERKRVLNPWDLVNETHKPNGAWAYIYHNGLGDHAVIPKNIISERG